jgi:hypothetical protein
MRVIGPHLPRRVGPQSATEPPGLPFPLGLLHPIWYQPGVSGGPSRMRPPLHIPNSAKKGKFHAPEVPYPQVDRVGGEKTQEEPNASSWKPALSILPNETTTAFPHRQNDTNRKDPERCLFFKQGVGCFSRLKPIDTRFLMSGHDFLTSAFRPLSRQRSQKDNQGQQSWHSGFWWLTIKKVPGKA